MQAALPMPQLQLQTDFRTDTVPTTDDGAQAPDYKRPCVMFSAPTQLTEREPDSKSSSELAFPQVESYRRLMLSWT